MPKVKPEFKRHFSYASSERTPRNATNSEEGVSLCASDVKQEDSDDSDGKLHEIPEYQDDSNEPSEQSALEKLAGQRAGQRFAYLATVGPEWTLHGGPSGENLAKLKEVLNVPASSIGSDWTGNQDTVNRVKQRFRKIAPQLLQAWAKQAPDDATETALQSEAAHHHPSESFAVGVDLATSAFLSHTPWPVLTYNTTSQNEGVKAGRAAANAMTTSGNAESLPPFRCFDNLVEEGDIQTWASDPEARSKYREKAIERLNQLKPQVSTHDEFVFDLPGFDREVFTKSAMDEWDTLVNKYQEGQSSTVREAKSLGTQQGRYDALGVMFKSLSIPISPVLGTNHDLNNGGKSFLDRKEELKSQYATSQRSHRVFTSPQGSSCALEDCQQSLGELGNTFHASAGAAFGDVLDAYAAFSRSPFHGPREDGWRDDDPEEPEEVQMASQRQHPASVSVS